MHLAEGGRFIPGTVNDFGGSSTAEFGPLLQPLPGARVHHDGADRRLQQREPEEPLPGLAVSGPFAGMP